MVFRFGTAGVPRSAESRSTVAGLRRLGELSLDCMEVQFVRGVRMSQQTAQEVRREAEKLGIRLSVHAPYYINLNSSSEHKSEASLQRIVSSAIAASACSARDVVFHAAYYMKAGRAETYQVVRRMLERALELLESEAPEVVLRPETTGRKSQFGTLEEVLTLSQELEHVQPCVDFAHIYARSRGGVNTYEQFLQVLEQVEQALGGDALRSMHIHLSGILYGRGGERSHARLEDSEFRYREVLRALADCGAAGSMVCESPVLEDDALLLRQSYAELTSRRR
ncbi:MAG: TIM barrel protein [Euryarchaeota archaeon]|nr:TIM barrel protein [Euryarchaeota archaeon]